MMSMEEKIRKITELKELERMLEDLEGEIEAAKDAIKAEMGDAEVMVAGPFKVTWKEVVSNRLDTTALKKAFAPEALAPYMKVSVSRPFKVTC